MENQKIISGKTILLNTKNNCTWIATDFDASIPNHGHRENDKHIEWTGELTIGATEKEYRKIAEQLWQLLDDIDTASDMFKPTINNPMSVVQYMTYVKQKHEQRFQLLTNDDENPNKLIIHPTYPKV